MQEFSCSPRSSRLVVALFAAALLPVLAGCPGLTAPTDDAKILESVLKWNQLAINASGLDHTPPAVGEDRAFAEQAGPTRASRAIAIVHIAMFDAVNAVAGGFQSYTRIPNATAGTSIETAIAQAARDTLVELFPAQSTTFDEALEQDLAAIADGDAKSRGVALGQDAARAILAMRDGDGSDVVEEYVFSNEPGKWRPDPINPTQQPLGEEWHNVKPFVLNSASQFRSPPPPAMNSAEYTAAFEEAKALGGDGVVTPTIRTEEQTQIGIYWAYDGTPSLCAPPRLYNQIARQLASDQGVSGVEMVRLLALINVGMADAGIAIWESKYHYNFWRPVTGIREADPGTGPTGLGDDNSNTVGDPTYLPLCAPASNLAGPNFTPPFPAYPSGHAGFGGALFETLREFFGTDDIEFTFVSDEFNGTTTDSEGSVRPLLPRSFSSLSQAEEENGQSRIYLGIHWSFDKTEGIELGRKVAQHTIQNMFQPLPR